MEYSVAVVIPTADRPELLKRAVDSVLRQSLAPSEILIVDNGNVPIEIGSIAPEVRVRVVRTEPRIGPGKSRNIGAREANAEFIAFLDDDDIWDAGYLSWIYRAWERTKSKALVARLMRSSGGKGIRRDYKIFPASAEAQRSVYFRNPGFGGQNIVINRQLFIDLGGFDEMMPASVDRDLAARLLQAGIGITVVPEAIAVLCDHDGERVRYSQVRGNWMFICKHFRAMTAVELAKAVRTYLKRWLSVRVFGRAGV